MTAEPVWALATELGEGPVWVGRDSALWFTDIKGQRIHRFDPASGDRGSWDAPGMPGFALPAADGGFVVGMADGLHRFDPADGSFAHFMGVEPELPRNRLNDAVVDHAGRLWFGTMDNDEQASSGMLYRLHHDGAPRAMGGQCVITNGPAISPDGATLYHVDTLGRTIHAFALDADGGIDAGRVFATIDPADGHPDGVSMDSEGHVWVGLYGGWCARRYAPDGTLVDSVSFPVANVTKVAFGGPDLRTAFATTARQGLDAEALAAQPLAGALFSFPVAVPGLAGHEVAVGLTRAE
ncbi:SMP-30/gluconolactonase/LRE family protein [Sphingomonas montana]|uniref:SMP-30/gluconolactonase/LRE family protein n=1 Tax=Sphingomonas montana TaxID=1843236 RepID=UPI00096D64D1|nr:SMP-30/gluconolactonase/LRE family protein [Sphingomonas montana]